MPSSQTKLMILDLMNLLQQLLEKLRHGILDILLQGLLGNH